MDPTTPNPPESIGPYRLEDLLGRGGMGEVYRAYDERLGRRVAIKHIRPEAALQRTTHERFRREASTVAKLSHPAIVQIFDVLDSDDGDWIVMEYVDGPTLTALVAEGPLGLERALTYGRQVAEGLAEAHEKGILHRDLKTENVMVAPSGHAKILDFGLAKRLDAESGEQTLTRGGEIMGTGRAMSPEQARGLELDPRSDLFSLGVLLYELLTGRPPFRGKTTLDTLTQLVTSHQVPVLDRVPGAPKELSDLVDRLLEKAPELRPTSAREVAETLEDIRLRNFSGVSRVRDLTDYAGATTFVSEATPVYGQPKPDEPADDGSDERAHSDSIFRTVSMRKSMWVGLAALVLFAVSAGWWLRSSDETSDSAAVSQDMGDLEEESLIDPYEGTQEGLRLLERYDRSENLEKATQLFRRVVEVDPDNAAAYAGLAEALWRRYSSFNPDPMLLTQAEAAAREAKRTGPFLADARAVLGLVLASDGKQDEARVQFDQALQLQPDHEDALLGIGLQMLAGGNLQEAEVHLKAALETHPESTQLLNTLGTVFVRQGRLSDAEAEYRRSVEIQPDGVVGYRNLAPILFMQGRASEAASVLQDALRIEPTPGLHSNLGGVLFFQGHYAQAAEAYRKVIDSPGRGNDYRHWANLGDAYRFVSGKETEAKEAFRKALRILEKELADEPASSALATRKATYEAKAGLCDEAIRTARDQEPLVLTPEDRFRIVLTFEVCGRRQLALDALARAYEAGLPEVMVAQDPELLDLRSDSRYQGLLLDS